MSTPEIAPYSSAPAGLIRCVLYGRTSLENERSVDAQLSELETWAQFENRIVVAKERDDGISASKFHKGKARAGWERVKALIMRGDVDELAVWEISRASRDLGEWLELCKACAQRGVFIVVRGRRYDPRNSEDWRRLAYDAVDAQAESGRTSERLLRGVRSSVAAGRARGPLPYGYAATFDAKGKTAGRIEHPQQGPIVREIATRLLAGETATRISHDLNRRGIAYPRGHKWTGSNIIQMMRKPCYAQIVVHQGKTVPDVIGQWPLLVSAADHRDLLARFDAPDRKVIRNGSHARRLGAGLYECGHCKTGRARTVTGSEKRRRATSYGCNAGSCFTRPADAIDALVIDVALERLADPGLLAALASTSGEPAAAAAAEEAARLFVRLEEARTAYAVGDLPLAALTGVERAVGPRLAAARKAATPRRLPPAVAAMAGPDAAARWEDAPIRTRREVVGALLTVTIHKTSRRGVAAIGASTADELCVTIEPR